MDQLGAVSAHFGPNRTESASIKPNRNRRKKKKKDLRWKRVQLRQQPHGVSMCVGCGCAIPGGAPMLFQNNTYSRNTFSNLKFTSVIDFSSRYLKKFDLGYVSYIPIGGAILIDRKSTRLNSSHSS